MAKIVKAKWCHHDTFSFIKGLLLGLIRLKNANGSSYSLERLQNNQRVL
jgi:hypothetical protein